MRSRVTRAWQWGALHVIRAALGFVFLTLSSLLASAGDAPYVRPTDIDLTLLLAPAPTPDSAITREDLRILLDLQATRTPEMVAMANADVQRTLSRFSDVIGTDLSPERAPLATALVDKAREQTAAIFLPAKATWKRLRPYVQFPQQVHLVVPPEETYSYPSGHAAFGMGTAIILARMVPEKAVAIFERGAQFGFERALAGVHYPSDVEAGRLSAVAITAFMMNDAGFQADLKAARAEVRGLLNLPPLPDDALPPITAPAPVPAPAR